MAWWQWWPMSLIMADTVLTFLGGRYPRDSLPRYARWVLADICGAVACLGMHIYWLAVALFALAAWWLWKWWDSRRRGRAKAWLGAKSKAVRDALVRKQREITKPRPVLRPVPGGTR